jgi:phosphomannomutase / phosphoglucomutase
MNPSVFREYDIRGVADRDFGDDFVESLGRAIGTMIHRSGAPRDGRRHAMAVGRDCRLTSPRIAAALARGITAAGVDVIDVDVVPTPVLYFAPFHWSLDGGVVITGSHNPPEDNGFKILCGTSTIHGEDIARLRAWIEQGDLEQAGPGRQGSITRRDAVTPYLEHAVSGLTLGPRRIKVVVDAGNGVGGPTALQLYRRLGVEVVDLFCDMDGTFPNHHPDPVVEANLEDLRQTVLAEGADLGIALDGDADRLGAVDGKGRVIWGDQLMILFGRDILAAHPGATIIGEVKCSQALYDELEKAGGKPIMWKVGHSLIKAKMKEVGAVLGGEMSGHIFFADRYPGFDDGIYAGARLIELLSRSPRTLAELYDELPVMVNTPELRIECPDDIKFEVVARTTARLRARDDVASVVDVDGARASFGDGWGLVRASNTQPALVLRCEAVSQERLAFIRTALETELAAARAEAAGSR